jgi:hypothetical protein
MFVFVLYTRKVRFCLRTEKVACNSTPSSPPHTLSKMGKRTLDELLELTKVFCANGIAESLSPLVPAECRKIFSDPNVNSSPYDPQLHLQTNYCSLGTR